MTTTIRLTDIPLALLPVVTSNERHRLWLCGCQVKEIFIFRDRYRVSTDRGELRFDLDRDDVTLEID